MAVLAAIVIVVAFPLVRWRPGRGVELGPLEVTPAVKQLSVRVGESVQFSVGAQGALGYTWTVWGRPVSFASTFSYTPAPEDAGWQQVTVEVSGRGGGRAARTWDVGVVPPTPPVLEEVTPPAGSVALAQGEPGSFRCRARLPAARPGDRLAVEWMLDDHAVRREEQPAANAISELALPPSEAGSHHLRVRVTEDGQSASIAEWTITVAAPEETPPAGPAPEQAAAVVAREEAPSAAPPEAAPPAEVPREAAVPPPEPRVGAPPPRLVRAPGPRYLEGSVGEPLVFQTRVEPQSTKVDYLWTIDRRRVRAHAPGRLEYEPSMPGRHTVRVAVAVAGQTIGSDAWVVTVLEPEVASATPPPVAELAPPATETAPPPAPSELAEAEVRAWLDEYARAWSRKDLRALRRMGQVRSAGEEEQLDRYFRSVDGLHVVVRVLGLRLDGARASVELERTDTVTDPSGRRHELRLPPVRKQIERTPEGLRFTGDSGPG